MLDKIKDIIVEFELFILTTELLSRGLDYKTKDKITTPLKECVELLKQVEKKLEEHSDWAHKRLDELEQND